MPDHPPSVYDLLRSKVHPSQLAGYYTGEYNNTGDQFFAATYLPELPAAGAALEALQQSFGTVSTAWQTGTAPPENHMLDFEEAHTPDTASAVFNGVHYNGEWHILSSLTLYCGVAEEQVKQWNQQGNVFDHDIYQPVRQNDSPTLSEFTGIPWLVAYRLQEEKEHVNRAFLQKLIEEVVGPLAANLQTHYPERYHTLSGLYYMPHFAAIFPKHKQFVLLATAAKGLQEADAHIRYLLYRCDTGAVFEWQYFTPAPAIRDRFLQEEIIAQLQTITGWNNVEYLHSSCTLDDEAFWQQYVFAEENGQYKYLKAIHHAWN